MMTHLDKRRDERRGADRVRVGSKLRDALGKRLHIDAELLCLLLGDLEGAVLALEVLLRLLLRAGNLAKDKVNDLTLEDLKLSKDAETLVPLILEIECVPVNGRAIARRLLLTLGRRHAGRVSVACLLLGIPRDKRAEIDGEFWRRENDPRDSGAIFRCLRLVLDDLQLV